MFLEEGKKRSDHIRWTLKGSDDDAFFGGNLVIILSVYIYIVLINAPGCHVHHYWISFYCNPLDSFIHYRLS